MEIFENAGFSFTYGRTKTEVFEYDDVVHHTLLALRMLRKRCYVLLSVFVWTAESDSNTLRVVAYFFENGENKSVFSKISGYVWTGPQFHDPDSFRLTHTSREGNFFFLFRGLSPWAVFGLPLTRILFKLSYSVAMLATTLVNENELCILNNHFQK